MTSPDWVRPITARQTGDAIYNPAPAVTRFFVLPKASQTITFDPIPGHLRGPRLHLAATASSGLPVTFVRFSGGSGVCTVSGSGLVHIVGPGTCGVRASQGGNASWSPAPNVNRTFAIAKGAQSITFGTIPGHTYGDPDFTVAATATSGLPVTFVRFSGGSGVCTVSSSGLVHIVGPGTCGVRAPQARQRPGARRPT